MRPLRSEAPIRWHCCQSPTPGGCGGATRCANYPAVKNRSRPNSSALLRPRRASGRCPENAYESGDSLGNRLTAVGAFEHFFDVFAHSARRIQRLRPFGLTGWKTFDPVIVIGVEEGRDGIAVAVRNVVQNAMHGRMVDIVCPAANHIAQIDNE